MSTRPKAERNVVLRSVGIRDYNKMIECWNNSGLQIKIMGRESKVSIRKEMQFKGATFIGAFEGGKEGKLVGLAIGNYDGRRGWINRIAVLPEYRRRGVATALMNSIEGFLRDKGARVIAALVSDSNAPSKALFERQGYKTDRDILYYAKRESLDA